MNSNLTNLPSRLAETPIAITGLASLFPGAHDLQQYWQNILSGVDFLEEVPSNRWELNDYYDPDPSAPDKIYCRQGGFLPEIDFNPLDFGLPPNILEVTDSTQLLTLLLAKSALKDAGMESASDTLLQQTGIILGVCGGQKLMGSLTARLQDPIWREVLQGAGLEAEVTEELIQRFKSAYVRWEENSFPGLLGNVIAGRVANRLNFGGTNCVVDAACGSSLAAMKMAISELREGRCDVMVTGGVDTDNSPFMYMCFSKTPAFTKRDRVQPFDAQSEGIMIGEGIGLVVLKRLADAERDGDRIYAVIKGVGSSSDGRFRSIYAPREEGQILAIRRAQEDANVQPDAGLGLIEAHGTGTKAGDLTEFGGLRVAYATERPQQIVLGTVKAQIGHTKAAAGVAGLIKVALSLHQRILPPLCQLESPHPDLNLAHSPFYFGQQPRPWIKGSYPRRAGVSAFGFGGSNFHFILEEAPHSDPKFRLSDVAQPVLLTANTLQELTEICADWLSQLQSPKAASTQKRLLSLATHHESPSPQQPRIGFVSASVEDSKACLVEALKTWEEQPEKEAWNLKSGIFYRNQGLDTSGKVVALFSGQGSQYLQMGRELWLEFPEMHEGLEALDHLFRESSREELSRILFPPPGYTDSSEDEQTERLQKTENAQPAIGSMSSGLYRILRRTGFEADFAAGHSFGELTALWAGGVLNDEGYHKLAVARGMAMAAPSDPEFDAGTMIAVMGKVDKLEPALMEFPDLKLANFNSNKQVVVAGPKDQILQAQEALKAQRFSVIPLPVSAAFHTPLVGHAQLPFAEAIDQVAFSKPSIPVFSNQTAKAYPVDPKQIRKQLQAHILESVQFKQEIENLYEAGGRIFVEFGPKNVLAKLTENILSGKEFEAIALNPNPKEESSKQFRQAFVRLQVLGVPLRNLDPYHRNYEGFLATPSKANVQLHGGNYVSEITRQAYRDRISEPLFFSEQNSASARESQDSEGERQS